MSAPPAKNRNSVKVTNLPIRVIEYDVRELFEKDCGRISSIDMPMEDETNMGYAVISFEADARKALNFDRYKWFGREIKVAYVQSDAPVSAEPIEAP